MYRYQGETGPCVVVGRRIRHGGRTQRSQLFSSIQPSLHRRAGNLMLTNPEDSSQPADISQSPPAADAGGGPSQLLGAFIDYLLARPTSGASESAGFDDGTSEMEGVTRGI